jgi:signal transduction histidine kinase
VPPLRTYRARLRAVSASRVDVALAAALLGLGLLEVAIAVDPASAALLLVAALTLPLAWRRRRPVGVALVVTAALAGQAALPGQPLFEQTFTGFVCMALAVYSLGRRAPPRAFARAVTGCGLAAGLAIGLHDASVASGLFAAVFVLGSGVGGQLVRRQARIGEILQAQADELEASAQAAARAAAIEERLRIARDLQDVVSDRVSEMVVQAQAASRLAAGDLARAGAALQSLEAKGRESLAEMRRLRRDDEEIALAPFPSLDRLAGLVDEARGRGPQIELVVEGERRPMSADEQGWVRRSGALLAPYVRWTDSLLVVVLTAAMATEAATVAAREGSQPANALAAIVVGAALLVRRRHPLAALIVGWVTLLTMTAFLTPATETSLLLVSVLLYSYAVAAHAGAGRARAGLAVGLTGIVTLNLLQPAGPRADDLVFPAILVVLAWFVGRMVRVQGALAAEVARRAQRIERAREDEAAAAAAEERRRMARELHDVVAHALTMMVVQAGGARRNLQRAPDRALQALVVVEQAGREALAELRRLLALAPPDAARAPQPGLGQLEALIDQTRAAGLPVELRIEGAPASLPGGLDLAAYRVVQEALTNAVRHAGPARARVLIHYEDRRLRLSVDDDGRPIVGQLSRQPGHGIAGMRERVRLYGGELSAGARPGGGFAVSATLPLSVQSPWDRDAFRHAEPTVRRPVSPRELL